jgi:hypothetical protein
MAIGYGVAVPKPERGADRITRRRKRETAATKFRNAVWKRAGKRCEMCGAGPLERTRDVLHPRAGHVAHNRGRNVAPEDKYNPDAALLKCRTCHLLGDHGMRF